MDRALRDLLAVQGAEGRPEGVERTAADPIRPAQGPAPARHGS
ncbi:hypothetical protein [Streptomyces hydrogenans]